VKARALNIAPLYATRSVKLTAQNCIAHLPITETDSDLASDRVENSAIADSLVCSSFCSCADDRSKNEDRWPLSIEDVCLCCCCIQPERAPAMSACEPELHCLAIAYCKTIVQLLKVALLMLNLLIFSKAHQQQPELASPLSKAQTCYLLVRRNHPIQKHMEHAQQNKSRNLNNLSTKKHISVSKRCR
jgi:hypothetical protein